MNYPVIRTNRVTESGKQLAPIENTRPARNKWLGRLTATVATNFLEIHSQLHATGGEYTTDCHKYQLTIFQRAGNALRALKILVENQAWDGAYGRIRYLLECYLVLKALNRDKERAAKQWEKTRYELHARPNVGPDQRLTEEDELGDLLQKERSKLDNREKRMYDHLSNRAMHPHTISSANTPGNYSSDVEKDCLRSGVFFAFGILAQLVNTYRDSDAAFEIRLSIDPVIVDIRSFTRSPPPAMLRDDLRLFDPSRFE